MIGTLSEAGNGGWGTVETEALGHVVSGVENMRGLSSILKVVTVSYS